MYLYFDKIGRLKEIINDEALRQGNYGINKLYIYIDDRTYDSIDASYLLPSKLIVGPGNYDDFSEEEIPYNPKRDLKFFKYHKTYKFLVVDLEGDIDGNGPLDEAGLVHCVLTALLHNGEQLQLGELNFNVEVNAVLNQKQVATQEYLSLSNYQYLRKLIGDSYTKEQADELLDEKLDKNTLAYMRLMSNFPYNAQRGNLPENIFIPGVYVYDGVTNAIYIVNSVSESTEGYVSATYSRIFDLSNPVYDSITVTDMFFVLGTLYTDSYTIGEFIDVNGGATCVTFIRGSDAVYLISLYHDEVTDLYSLSKIRFPFPANGNTATIGYIIEGTLAQLGDVSLLAGSEWSQREFITLDKVINSIVNGSNYPVQSGTIYTELLKYLKHYNEDDTQWDTIPTVDSVKPVTSGGIKSAIDNATSSALKYQGTKTVAEINALGTTSANGDTYNVSNSGTLTYGNVSVVRGDNVAWKSDTQVWNKLSTDISGLIPKTDIVNNLITTDTTKVLSADQGKVLKDLIDELPAIVYNAVYPVGSIYVSTTRNTNTINIVGKVGCPLADLISDSTWERINGRFLYGAEDNVTNFEAGDTGGSKTYTLLEENLPAHTHDFSGNYTTNSSNITLSGETDVDGSHTHGYSGSTNYNGSHTHTVYQASLEASWVDRSSGTSNSPCYNETSGIITTYRDTGGEDYHNYNLTAGTSDGWKVLLNASHTHTMSSAGSHFHEFSGTTDSSGSHTHTFDATGGEHTHTFSISGTTDGGTGSGTAFSIMPPFVVVYMWKRIS